MAKSNTQLSTIDPKEEAKLAMILGGSEQTAETSKPEYLPEIKMNVDDEDAEGNPIKKGLFWIKGLEGERAFADTINIRPLAHHYQYLHWSQAEKRMANKTILITNWSQEPKDERGTIRCGKPSSKEYNQLNDNEKAKFSEVKCFRQVRCLVDFDGKTSTGEKVTHTNLPAIILLKGSNFSPFEDEYTKALPKGSKIWDYKAKVTTERKKQGSVVYFVMHFEPDLKTKLGLDDATFETMKGMASMIERENRSIISKYNQSLRNTQEDMTTIDAVVSHSDDLNEDFED
tara:strand:- start:148 stop:1008 length:861 start_codon:yes stop_codon:yes gene_type:complete